MKSPIVFVAVLSAASILTACNKNNGYNQSQPPPVDPANSHYSNYLLQSVSLPAGSNMPVDKGTYTFEYDSLKRVTKKSGVGTCTIYTYEADRNTETVYANTASLANMTSQSVYYFDTNKNITHHTTAWYNNPASVENFTRMDVVEYEYNAEGKLAGQKTYMFGNMLINESRYTWQNGSLTHQENVYYNVATNPSTELRTDVIDYTLNSRSL